MHSSEEELEIRKLCGYFQVQRHSTTVLSAMMAGMDDKEDLDDDITLEAMSGLSRILAEIDESHIRAILINIALRIRPSFEKVKAKQMEKRGFAITININDLVLKAFENVTEMQF